MYGTVARLKVKAGRWDDLLAVYDEWDRDLRPKVNGAVAGYLYKLDKDPNAAVMAAVFEDREAYEANSDDPEQDKWYRRFRDCLDADPEWSDGEIVRAG